MRADLQTNPDEAQFDRMSAHKTREQIVANLTLVIEDPTSAERGDLKWIHATLANCLLALGDDAAAGFHEVQFRNLQPAGWEVATFETGRIHALAISVAHKARR